MVIKVTHNADIAIKKLDAYKRIVEGRLGTIIPAAAQELHVRASFIIQKVIYNAYAPVEGGYKRTGKLLAAVEIFASAKEGAVYIDGDQIPDLYPGTGYDIGYAAYFLRGDGLLLKAQKATGINTKPKRDFMGDDPNKVNQWFGMTVQLFLKKYLKIFEEAALSASIRG